MSLPLSVQTGERIIAENVTVTTNHNVTFKSKEIILKPGFTAPQGSSFHAKIEGCVSNNPSSPTGPYEGCGTNARVASNVNPKVDLLDQVDYGVVHYDTTKVFNRSYFNQTSTTRAFQKASVYPNPTNGTVTIDFPSQTETYTIDLYDLHGVFIKREDSKKLLILMFHYPINKLCYPVLKKRM